VSWLKHSISDKARFKRNIRRLEGLRSKIERLRELLAATQSGSYGVLQQIMGDQLVQANHDIASRLDFLLSSENNQKVILDSPHRSASILNDVIALINTKILKWEKCRSYQQSQRTCRRLTDNNPEENRSRHGGSSDLRVQNVVHVLNMRGAAISLVYKKRSCLARRK